MSTEHNIKVTLSTYNNDWYNPGAGIVKRTLWYFLNVLFLLNPLNPTTFVRVWLLKLFGAKIGKGVVMKHAINIKYPWFLQVGNNVWLGENVWIDNLTNVIIRNDVCISQGAMLLTGNHNYKKSSFDLIVGAILIEEGVWIGAKSVVSPGCVCRKNSILSVNSVATSDLEENTIYQGNPALPKRVRNFEFLS